MKIYRTLILILVSWLSFNTSQAQSKIERIEPPNWWVGMQNPKLQLLLYGKNISRLDPVIKYKGLKIDSINRSNNRNYLFIYLNVSSNAQPGVFNISLRFEDEEVTSCRYELKLRKPGSADRTGFNQADNVYLLMPDRFANGDTTNDSDTSMMEWANRDNPDGRHGGDLKGIANHLSYFNDLGMTALWLNPHLENNMPSYSYHGYAITDFYKTDPRLGTNQDFVNLVSSAHSKKIKIIMDMVFNHCGVNHWFIKDLPFTDWIHQFPSFTRSNFKAPAAMDPYAASYDKNLLQNGWFDTGMPDLNQKNPHLAAYLIQNSIWWIEFADLDGIRMDTHMYADPDFMAEWRRKLRSEYPNFNVVGELWVETKALHAYWMKDAPNNDGYNSELEYITDFPLFVALRQALQEPTGWESGAERLYYCLAQDIVYKRPQDNLTFLSNHDVHHFYSICGEDFGKYKLGVAFLFTTRGIPQFYHGTEVLLTGSENQGHGKMRKDFPGGWTGDKNNGFDEMGRTPQQQAAWQYVQKIAQWRQTSKAAQFGKLTQFIPEKQVYTYFRTLDNEQVMVLLNFSNTTTTVNTNRFSEQLSGYTKGTDIISGTTFETLSQLNIPGHTALIIELHK